MFSHGTQRFDPLRMAPATPLERLRAARRALAEASSAAGVPLARGNDGFLRPGCLPTGIDALDEALGGGLPRGRIVEIVGRRSSGRLSLTLAMLSRAMREGQPCALIDPADALDPRALHPDDRAQLLWVRPPDALTALSCADLLLDAGGFALVALYLVGMNRALARDETRTRAHTARARDPEHTTFESVAVTGRRGVGPSAWARLARRARAAQCAIVVALDEGSPQAPGAFSHAALTVRRHRACWHGRELLETLEADVSLARVKFGVGVGISARVIFKAG